MPLTTVNKVKQYMSIAPSDTAQDALITTLITVLDVFLPRYCNRGLIATSHKDWVDGDGADLLWLDNFPINTLARVCMGKVDAGTITCVNTTASSAYFDVSATQITLTIVGGTDAGTDNITYVANATLADVLAAINAVGKGWAATITSTFLVRLSSDCVVVMGVYCLNSIAYLGVPDDPLYDVELYNADQGILHRDSGFDRGRGNIFVEYNGGYSTIPNDLSLAATRIIAQVLRESPRDLTLKSERIGDYTWTAAENDLGKAVEINREWLQPWIRTEI